ncbi:hypothetical protein BHE74_00012675 [Ensete ventricosum]|nr:hypothetical protein BHE74_00012675 [Ensete ventricosum]RZR91437.1 hypothetical protein BHM03_00019551 [Ensete ventricosum]
MILWIAFDVGFGDLDRFDGRRSFVCSSMIDVLGPWSGTLRSTPHPTPPHPPPPPEARAGIGRHVLALALVAPPEACKGTRCLRWGQIHVGPFAFLTCSVSHSLACFRM